MTMMWRQYGAVRSPPGRLMPNAAHNRSEMTCGGSGRSEYARFDRRRASASMSGLPPLLLWGGRQQASAFSAAARWLRLFRSKRWPDRKNRASQKRGVSFTSCHVGYSKRCGEAGFEHDASRCHTYTRKKRNLFLLVAAVNICAGYCIRSHSRLNYRMLISARIDGYQRPCRKSSGSVRKQSMFANGAHSAILTTGAY